MRTTISPVPRRPHELSVLREVGAARQGLQMPSLIARRMRSVRCPRRVRRVRIFACPRRVCRVNLGTPRDTPLAQHASVYSRLQHGVRCVGAYSHSIVAGGFPE